MEFITQLWLPIIVGAVLVFVVSSILHMATPIHKGDFKKLKHEDAVLDALRNNSVEPGSYMFPCAGSMKEMGSPEMKAKWERGPVGWLTVADAGGFNMGKSLGFWMLYCVIVCLFAAYAGWYGLGHSATFAQVFRVVGAASLLGFAAGYMHDPIWKGGSWVTAFKFFFDGAVYALVTAATFGLLWPHA